jgi:acyl-CoA synthetase (AMP-forming)/AMP-acid ligase II
MPKVEVLDGGPAPACEYLHLAEVLEHAARFFPDNGVVHLDQTGTAHRTTYREQLGISNAVAGRLRAAGRRPGDLVQLPDMPNGALVDAFWGCQLAGAVPVVLPAGHPVDPRYPSLMPAGDDLAVVPGAGEFSNGLDDGVATAAGAALVIFTAGGGGRRRPITLTQRQVLNRTAATCAHNGWDDSERTYNCMPLRHVSGLLMFHVRDVYLGAEQVHDLPHDVLADPRVLIDRLGMHRASLSWITPPVLRSLVGHLHGGDRLRAPATLRTLMVGGDRISSSDVAMLQRQAAIDDGVIVPGYGLTEAASGIVSASEQPSMAAPVLPVGRPEPGTVVRIVRDARRPAGDLEVRGPSEEAESQWLATGDVGFIHAGALTVLGSKADLFDASAGPCHASEIEDLLSELPWRHPESLIACPAEQDPTRLVLYVSEADYGGSVARTARAVLRETTGLELAAVRCLPKTGVPRAPHGKPLRTLLARSAG